jgi:hypothetical protein
MGTRKLLACIVVGGVLTCMLAACSDAALFGLIKSRRRARPVPRQSLILFPFDKDAESAAGVPDDFGKDIADYLCTTLANSKGYAAMLYKDRLMPIQRALTDNAVKEQETKAPYFTDKPKADKLADILATDYYIVGSVESYAYDRNKKTVDLALKADLVLTKTGKVTQEFMVGGSAAAGTQAMDEDELRSIAAGKAVEALGEKILSTSSADTKPAAQPKPKPKK